MISKKVNKKRINKKAKIEKKIHVLPKEINAAHKIEKKIIKEIQKPPIQDIADFSKNILIDSDNLRKPKIRVIGIGGGACSVVSEIATRMNKSDFYAANTDARALASIKEAKKFQFGESVTKGLGTGMNPQLGEAAAHNDKERIKKLFEGQDFCILIACLGGGTSSGAAPLFAKAATEMNCLTYGIFTLPFGFEGEKKMEMAKESLSKIKSHLNAYSVIPNERIFKIIDKNTPLTQALSAVNKSLADNLEGLMEMICSAGLINIDFADLTAVLAGRGKLAYLSSFEAGGGSNAEAGQGDAGRDIEAVQKVVSNPLHPYTISGAHGILYNIVGGKDLQLAEVSKISNIISGMVSKDAKIIFGINQNPKAENRIKIVLFAVGCGSKGVFSSQEQQKIDSILSKIKISASSPQKIVSENKKLPEKKILKVSKKKKVVPEQKKKVVRSVEDKRVKDKIDVSFVEKKEEESIPSTMEMKIDEPSGFGLKKISFVEKEEDRVLEKSAVKPAFASTTAGTVKKPVKSDNYFWAGQMVIPDGKIRRSGSQLKKAVEEEEKEINVKENAWDAPAIFRREKKS